MIYKHSLTFWHALNKSALAEAEISLSSLRFLALAPHIGIKPKMKARSECIYALQTFIVVVYENMMLYLVIQVSKNTLYALIKIGTQIYLLQKKSSKELGL